MSTDQDRINGTPDRPGPARVADDRGRPLPLSDEQRRDWIERGNRALDALAEITDESDTAERWDEALRNLGVDPATGRGLGS